MIKWKLTYSICFNWLWEHMLYFRFLWSVIVFLMAPTIFKNQAKRAYIFYGRAGALYIHQRFPHFYFKLPLSLFAFHNFHRKCRSFLSSPFYLSVDDLAWHFWHCRNSHRVWKLTAFNVVVWMMQLSHQKKICTSCTVSTFRQSLFQFFL